MTYSADKLEHLLSRHLDGECTLQEQQLLRALLRREPAVRARLEDYERLDRAVGDALRTTMGRTARAHGAHWARVGKSLVVAAAACLAALAWLQPRLSPTRPGASRMQQAGTGSWFAPNPPAGDSVEPTPPGYERPELRLQGTQRDWIVIPGDKPGTYLVIEVDHVRTHVISVHRDF
jgi:hypothetical protein